MEKFVLKAIIALLIFGAVMAADRDYPPEVPDRPDEYQDGLKP